LFATQPVATELKWCSWRGKSFCSDAKVHFSYGSLSRTCSCSASGRSEQICKGMKGIWFNRINYFLDDLPFRWPMVSSNSSYVNTYSPLHLRRVLKTASRRNTGFLTVARLLIALVHFFHNIYSQRISLLIP
jgi:hypothetical protein